MRPRITLTNAVGLTRVTSNRRVNQSSRIFLLTRPGFIEVDAAARIHSTIAGPIMMRNTLPPLASSDLFDGACDMYTARRHLQAWPIQFVNMFRVPTLAHLA